MLFFFSPIICFLPAAFAAPRNNITAADLRAVNIPCMCAFPVCDCCAQFSLGPQFSRELGCAQLTFLQEDLGVRLELQVAGRTLLERELSVANPPPACVSVPMLPIAFCATVYNLRLSSDGSTACLRLSIQLLGADAVALDLQCLRLDGGGQISILQPPYSRHH